MSERPAVVLVALFAAAAVFAALLAAGVAALGSAGLAELAATVVGSLSACVFFLAELQRVPLSSLVLVGLALASAGGFVVTIVSYRREQRLLRALPLEPVRDGELLRLAACVGVRLEVVRARRPAAFCFGVFRPRVVITSGLVERLDEDELTAAVWHEAQHVRTHEPLRCLLARLAASTFFWIPALRDLFDRYLLTKELDADRVARRHTSRRALAGALHEVIAEPPVAGAVGLADLAAARVDRLFDPLVALPPLFRRSRIALSLVAVTLLGLVLAFPANLSIGEETRMHSMLTSMSLHGLPGMAVGLAFNGAVLGCTGAVVRRLLAARRAR